MSKRTDKKLLLGLVVFLVPLTVLLLRPRADGATNAPDARLKVGVVGHGPEAEVLAFVGAAHPELGLAVLSFEDVASARAALREGKIDLGSFETAIALDKSPEFNSLGVTVSLPFAFYSRQLARAGDLPRGARVVLPRDSVGRGLALLKTYGLVNFDEALGVTARLDQLSENKRELVLEAVASPTVKDLDDSALVGLDYEHALALGLRPARHGLLLEDGFSAFAKSFSAKPGRSLGALGKAYYDKPTKDFILGKYEDSVRRPW